MQTDSLGWVWLAVAFAAAVFFVNAVEVRAERRDGLPVTWWRLVCSGLLLAAILPWALWETATDLIQP
jgi:hypothetical protein